MDVIIFLAYLIIAIQSIVCKCTSLAVLSALCLVSLFFIVAAPSLPGWLRFLIGTFVIGLLGGFMWDALRQNALYLGRISEYRYVALEAGIVLLLNVLALLPGGKKQEKAVPAKEVSDG